MDANKVKREAPTKVDLRTPSSQEQHGGEKAEARAFLRKKKPLFPPSTPTASPAQLDFSGSHLSMTARIGLTERKRSLKNLITRKPTKDNEELQHRLDIIYNNGGFATGSMAKRTDTSGSTGSNNSIKDNNMPARTNLSGARVKDVQANTTSRNITEVHNQAKQNSIHVNHPAYSNAVAPVPGNKKKDSKQDKVRPRSKASGNSRKRNGDEDSVSSLGSETENDPYSSESIHSYTDTDGTKSEYETEVTGTDLSSSVYDTDCTDTDHIASAYETDATGTDISRSDYGTDKSATDKSRSAYETDRSRTDVSRSAYETDVTGSTHDSYRYRVRARERRRANRQEGRDDVTSPRKRRQHHRRSHLNKRDRPPKKPDSCLSSSDGSDRPRRKPNRKKGPTKKLSGGLTKVKGDTIKGASVAGTQSGRHRAPEKLDDQSKENLAAGAAKKMRKNRKKGRRVRQALPPNRPKRRETRNMPEFSSLYISNDWTPFYSTTEWNESETPTPFEAAPFSVDNTRAPRQLSACETPRTENLSTYKRVSTEAVEVIAEVGADEERNTSTASPEVSTSDVDGMANKKAPKRSLKFWKKRKETSATEGAVWNLP